MSDDVQSFIKGHMKRDLYISRDVDEKYIEPIVKLWKSKVQNQKEIGKQEVILLGMAIGYKLEKEKRLKEAVNCEKAQGGKLDVDMGRIAGTDAEEKLIFLLTLSIAKYGIDETIKRFDSIVEELEMLAEKGIMYMYCILFNEIEIFDKQLESILDIEKLLAK
ncbi:MAG: hypothetical protein M1528_02970 [Candidatus Marsarchaeota archaeon]|nr:hypothetical protein [Candidatus Marsarchaeota archaeon]